jgi:hypothetical protein
MISLSRFTSAVSLFIVTDFFLCFEARNFFWSVLKFRPNARGEAGADKGLRSHAQNLEERENERVEKCALELKRRKGTHSGRRIELPRFISAVCTES